MLSFNSDDINDDDFFFGATVKIKPRPPLFDVSRSHAVRDKHPVGLLCTRAQLVSSSQRTPPRLVFLNRRAAARYRALASIIPGRERPEATTIRYKISLVQLITNLKVILYLSTCHTVYTSVLIFFMIMS